MASGCGQGNGSANGHHAPANLAFAKFLFLIARADDDAHSARLRTAGGNIARGFFNDFDIDDARETQGQRFETIQFFVRDGDAPDAGSCPRSGIQNARHMVQVSSKYRPRLQEIDEELRRRIGDSAEILSLDGAFRNPRYSSPEMVHYSNKGAASRRSGRLSRNAIVMPMRKTTEWWQQSSLERHSYFYPHGSHEGAAPMKGHAIAAEKGIASLFRRVYHNPDGYERQGEFDFVTYFECDDESLPVFDQVLSALRDVHQNPEWKYVEEGPIWRGRRVLRW
jgi:chlorite dismutase